jgi:hypothetical protein
MVIEALWISCPLGVLKTVGTGLHDSENFLVA